MCAWIVQPEANLIETAMAPEIYVDGVGAIECHNGSIRFYLYTDQMPLEGRGTAQKVVCAKVICSPGMLPTVMGQLALCMTHRGEPERFERPRLVT